ncbi:MAG: response regulator [Deltaproteobacteria bacterium]|jgi:DNA-binding NtrC family response regulator|nr:MAG: response regulator [Deltaproteobacteria bacterium]
MKIPRILLVDDEVAFANNILKLLSKRGYDVIAVNDGASAIRTIGEKEFDVVILDMKMPGMDGIATLKEIKKKEPLAEVVILTGHGSVESGIEGMQLGAFDFVMKPVSIDDLHEKVCQAYQRKLIEEERVKQQESGR